MAKKTFYSTSGIIFFIIAMIHFLRIILNLKITFGEAVIPMWWSWATVIVAGVLSYHGLQFSQKLKK